ncbi:hypothetical protein B5F73_03710 [Olsenella sp. An270]|nr:hypothetical protein B5F73_03710 [Olsenella sp. An270]
MRGDTVRASLAILVRDLKRLLRSPVALLVTLGVCLIPSAYAWLNVLANWDPYENTATVPVAVAVEDAGADVPGLGPVNAGALIRERLEQNHQLDWTFVDEATALEGVRSGRYYAAFVIPRDFTGTLAGAVSGHARSARVSYYVNEKANAVAPKVTDTGATTLEDQVSSEFVRVAGEAVAEKVQAAVGGATGAADETAGDALAVLRGAEGDLSETADAFDAARGAVAQGRAAVARTRDALDDASGGARSLARDLDGALGTLGDTRARIRSFARDLSSDLGTGASTLSALASQASHDVALVAGDVGWAQGKLDAAASEVEAAGGTLRTVGSALGRARDALAALSLSGSQAAARDAAVAALDEQVRALDELADSQDAQAAGMRAVSQEVAAGAEDMEGLAGSVADAAQTGADALSGLQADLAQDVSPELAGALDALGDAGGRLAGGADALPALIGQAQGTLDQLDAVLASASSTLEDGAATLRDASADAGALADDLAALRGAADPALVTDVLELDPAEAGAALASPVDLVTEAVYPVANYGSGVAPFYTNLALWVGGFVLVAVYKLEVDHEGLPGDAAPVTATQAFWGRWLLLALLGQVQAVVCCVGDLALGVQSVSPAAYVLAGMVASLVYVLVIYALAATLKHVGKALAVLLVVLQIPGASGLYPIQMQPAFFQALGPWLPFTYGINAMREAVGGFYDGNYVRDLLVLLAFALPALALATLARPRLLDVDAFFDRELARTDLLVTERTGERDGRLGAVLRALGESAATRDALLERERRFERLYPARMRRGLAALVVAPACALALGAALPGARLVLLAAWAASLAVTCCYLVGLDYLRERLRERGELGRMGRRELVDAALGEKGGER